MATFKDARCQEWLLAIDVTELRRVKKLLGYDLLEAIGKPESFERLYTDPVFLCDLLYVLCQQQAEQRGVSDEDFGRGLAGDAIDRAAEALVKALADFFPNPRRREMILRELENLRRRDDKAIELTEAELTRINQRIDEQLASQVRASGERLLNSLESSASTPDRSRSAN